MNSSDALYAAQRVADDLSNALEVFREEGGHLTTAEHQIIRNARAALDTALDNIPKET